jgi:hypothetical protein
VDSHCAADRRFTVSLGELIAALEEALRRGDTLLGQGFGKPGSYRGYYAELAFEPANNVTVSSMLAHAKSALGATFKGYKGGAFTMSEYTPCWIARYGTSAGDLIGPMLFGFMLSPGNWSRP